MTTTSFAKPVTPTTAALVLMVPPEGIAFNTETAKSNAYQQQVMIADVQHKAMHEFKRMVATLEANGIRVITLAQPNTLPDAVFPNNWFSTHTTKDGKTMLIIYPMLTPNRQAEVNQEGLIKLLHQHGVTIDKTIDLRNAHGEVLEGTGSMVLDRENKLIYASLSERTNAALINRIATLLNYKPLVFHSFDTNDRPIYHTNVMMSIAAHYAVICLSCITDKVERENVVNALKTTGKMIIDISQAQVNHMCGNVLALTNANGDSILVMSQNAYEHFTKLQLKTIESHSKIVATDIRSIETIGGGSARCMMAEIV